MKHTTVENKSSGTATDNKRGILQRKCACGRPKGPTGACAECGRKRSGVQAKLRVNRPGDRYEQEADRVASQVLSMSEPANISPVQTMSVQRSAVGEIMAADYAPPAMGASNGHSLPVKTRQYFEPRFGQDFSQVRIHTDSQAAQDSRNLNARAFTLGRDISFGSNEFAPQTTQGQQLIAHELTHILQQRQAPASLVQREPEEGDQTETPAAEGEEKPGNILQRQDIVFSLASETAFKAAAAIASPGVQPRKVGSPSDMATALNGVGFPIDTIYIFSHSTPDASIKFPGDNWVSAGSLASTIKDSVPAPYQPNTIDFRGCSVGMDPSGMDELRQAVGAQIAIGSSCWLVLKHLGITVDGVHIKDKSQLANPKVKATLNKKFSANADSFQTKACILDKSKDAYFKAGGYFVSVFANKELNEVYSETDSVCYKNLPVETLSAQDALTKKPAAADPCKLIRIEEKAPAAPEAAPVSPPPVGTQPETQDEEASE